MHIANPIYDTVFKYLLEDNRSAILLLSGLLGEDIDNLQLLPQEGASEVEFTHRSLTVYRLDFSATIKTATGSRQILIEIQKAKFASDIMRFRRYLGDQYKHSPAINTLSQPLPLYTIYFLGYQLEQIKTPIIKVNRHYYDGATEQRIDGKKEPFIEMLTHDSLIIQIPYLNKTGQSQIEKLLRIFDQHQQLTHDVHILDIADTAPEYPPKYQYLIRRLQRAIANKAVRQTMDIEDDILMELNNKEREASQALDREQVALDREQVALDREQAALEAKGRALEEKDLALKRENEALEEKGRALEDKFNIQKDNEEKDRMIQALQAQLLKK